MSTCPLVHMSPCILVSDPGAPTLWGGAVTDVEGVTLTLTRPQARDHGYWLLVAADLTELSLLHHDLAAVLAEFVHLELDNDPPLLLRDLVLHLFVLRSLPRSLTEVIVSSDQLTTINYLLLTFLTLEELFNYFLKASITSQTVLENGECVFQIVFYLDVFVLARMDQRIGEETEGQEHQTAF